MYSYEERMKAVKLFIKYDKSCMAVINELGYPCRGTLLAWYKEFSRKGDLNHVRMRRYSKVEFFYGRSWRGWSMKTLWQPWMSIYTGITSIELRYRLEV